MITLSTLAFASAKSILAVMLPIPNSLYCAIGFGTPVFIMAGERLKRFAKPDSPYVSNFVCSVFILFYWVGKLLAFITIFLVICLVVFAYVGEASSMQLFEQIESIFFYWLGGSVAGLSVALCLVLRLIPEWERGEGLHDVSQLVKSFKKLNGYSPLPYIDVQKGCFIGVDSKNKTIYVAWKKVRETHIQIIGTTGCGKGVIMTLIAYQAVLAGESVVFFDPKFDRFSPRILSDAAKKANRGFYFINLNPDQPPQLNPIADAEAYEIEELLVSAFDLKAAGSDGDFHRGKDEDAAIQASKIAVDKGALSIPSLIEACSSVDFITKQENFWRKLCKLGDLNAIKTSEGINLKDAILSKSVIYIVGSTDNERVKMLQKLLLVRVNQILKKQDRLKKYAPTCIVLDEFKHVLSPTSLTILGVIRDYSVHYLLSHQSLGDLDSCPGITRAEAEGAVLDNTAIKIIYRLGDSSYAEKLSKNSGKRAIFIEQSGKNHNSNHHAEGGWLETHVPLIDPDVLTHLPMPSDRNGQASVGVLFGVGVARVFHVGHISCSGDLPSVQVAPECAVESSRGSDLI